MKLSTILFLIGLFSLTAFAQDWRKMSEAELRKTVPEKAPVIRENIETELRTAAGITDGKANIFGVVIITAGYEADGKYTHYFRSDVALRVGDLPLEKGEYIFGYQRLDADTLRVTFFRSKDGELVGATKAKVEKSKGAIYSFLITPPAAKKGRIYIGRFSFDYSLE
ncbi:MAG: hypothetical protein JSS81_13140 [Acidobacteria bacterium]|nr:hypothetical protein [Acidobacteriota bacterium]